MATSGLDANFTRSTIARYLQLALLFRRRIATGEWPVGSRIPTVDELTAEFGVARITIRQALNVLSKENLIERKRSRGTFVIRGTREEAWYTIPTDWAGMLRPASEDARIEVISKSRHGIDLPFSNELGRVEGKFDFARRRHWLHERAYVVTDVYISESLRDRRTHNDLIKKTAMRLATDLLGPNIGDSEHNISIGTADLETSEVLAIPVNYPVIHVRREVTDRTGRLALVSDGTYRGDVARVDIQLNSSPRERDA